MGQKPKTAFKRGVCAGPTLDRTLDRGQTAKEPAQLCLVFDAGSAESETNETDVATTSPAAHMAWFRGAYWSWTGTSWRPALRYEEGLARELERSIRPTAS